MAHQFVRKQINQAIPLGFNRQEESVANPGQPTLTEVFFGSPVSIRFVGPMPGYLGFGGPQVQELNIVDGRNGKELVLTHALLQGFEDASLYERDPIVLIDHIEFAEFKFLTRDEEEEIAGWIGVWEETGMLPVAVALEIEFEEGVYTDWPMLIAAVKVDPSAVSGAFGGDDSYQSAVRELIEKRRLQN
jgi:general secretion pathway protein J